MFSLRRYLGFYATAAKLLQSCPTLCDPRDGSPPGSPVPGILQARTLEWVEFSKGFYVAEPMRWKFVCLLIPECGPEL